MLLNSGFSVLLLSLRTNSKGRVQQKLNTETFFVILRELDLGGTWRVSIEDKCIHLRRHGSKTIFSPLTAVYCELTNKEIHRGSFWVEELTQEFGFPWYEVMEISYAWSACSCGRAYDKVLRDRILKALDMQVEIKVSAQPSE